MKIYENKEKNQKSTLASQNEIKKQIWNSIAERKRHQNYHLKERKNRK